MHVRWDRPGVDRIAVVRKVAVWLVASLVLVFLIRLSLVECLFMRNDWYLNKRSDQDGFHEQLSMFAMCYPEPQCWETQNRPNLSS